MYLLSVGKRYLIAADAIGEFLRGGLVTRGPRNQTPKRETVDEPPL